MNPSVKQLYDITQKQTRTIIGLMSGTSLDGLDIALCSISGSGKNTSVNLHNFTTIEYDSEFKQRLKAITSIPDASMEEICLLNAWLGDYHGELILESLNKWKVNASEIDCIASHGQTIYHAPKIQHRQPDMPNATLQIGDGDHIAHKTGIITISDFRQKHTASGGEGAPLAAPVDQLLFTNGTEHRILLNIGGIANFTYLPAGTENNQPPITTDTGPGNTLIDAATQKYFCRDYDENAHFARNGTINRELLQALKTDPFFQKPLPKTTGPEVFNLQWIESQFQKIETKEISPNDLLTTLTRFTAETIAESIQQVLDENQHAVLYASGGGFHNPLLMEWLSKLMPDYSIESFAKIGFNPDAKEAVLFAVLANETLAGNGFLIKPGDPQKINFGKISFPG